MATVMANVGDEMITLAAENSHALYYRIGQKITVTWMAKYRLYCCLTCNLNRCPHTRRVAKYRKEHA